MATVEVSQSLENKVGQLNVAPILEVQNFTNWKKRFLCHILGIEPQFKNIIKNGPFIPMTAGQRKPKVQWTRDERKAAKIDQRLKSLIMSVLSDDQMNSVINCLTAKSTWDDRNCIMRAPLIYKALMNELVNDGIKLSKLEMITGFINVLPKKWLSFCQSLKNTNHVKDSELASLFGLSRYTNDEEDTSSHEYLNDLEEEYQARALLAKSKRFFKKDEEEVSSDDNDMVKVKVLMALAEENDAISKEVARNGEWVKISMRKVHTLLEIEDNYDRTTYLDYLILPTESQRNTTDPLVVVTDSSVTDYDSTDKSSVCSTPLPTLKKLDGAEPISGPKTIKSILRSKSTFKAKTLKGVITN
nr:hypothetical protein [Tanacetum cinerariifolium]